MKRLLHAIIFPSVLFAFGCSAMAQNKRNLSEQERFRLAADYSKNSQGVSVLVMKGEKIIFEEYQNGHESDEAWFLASGTKSFSGVMCAAAIEDGLIKDFDEKVSETITEWKTDKQKSRITLRQLLSLTSGIDAGQIGRVPTYAEAINFPVETDAGTKFEYGPVPFQIFGEVMRRKLLPKKETVMDYLKRRILAPIGLKVGFWREGRDGNPLLPQGAGLTAREWAKFGVFLKNGGKSGGKQIVEKKLLDALIVGSKSNPAYGLTFWLNRAGIDPRGQAIEARLEAKTETIKDLYMAAGLGNQRLYIIPSMDLVIVRQGNFAPFDDGEFLKLLLFGETK